jgi:1-deoxyxylulose-5-phosphate synthase
MRYLTIPGLDRPVSRIALGVISAKPTNPEPLFELLDAFVELGGTMLDTAHIYGLGDCERTIGMWLASRGRDKIMVLDKGCHPIGNSGPRVGASTATTRRCRWARSWRR